jgi:hypothetical protein
MIDNPKSGSLAIGANRLDFFNEFGSSFFNHSHAGWIAEGPHVCFHKNRISLLDAAIECLFQQRPILYSFDKVMVILRI